MGCMLVLQDADGYPISVPEEEFPEAAWACVDVGVREDEDGHDLHGEDGICNGCEKESCFDCPVND